MALVVFRHHLRALSSNSKDGEPIMSTGLAEGWMTGELGRVVPRALHRWAPCLVGKLLGLAELDRG